MALPNNFNDNTTDIPDPGDVGIRISKPFYDATTAADSDLIFSSAWPGLPVAFETIQSTTWSSPAPFYQRQLDSNISVAHGLNITPFTQAWYTIDGGTTYRWYPMASSNATSAIIDSLPMEPLTAASGTLTFKIVCYNIDMTRDVDYAYSAASSATKTYDPDYGIRLAKDGESINSTDMRDFILHSRCQSPLILSVKTEETKVYNEVAGTPVNVVQFTTDYGYRAWVFGAIKNSASKYGQAPLYGQAYPRTFTDGYTSYLQYTGTDIGATLVVLRDPMFASSTTAASY